MKKFLNFGLFVFFVSLFLNCGNKGVQTMDGATLDKIMGDAKRK
ncbi:MAG: hypothetical protein P1P64_04815 [Treponemataceae bacterium]